MLEPKVIKQWTSKSLVWGSIMGGFALSLIVIYLTVPVVKDYVEMEWFYVFELLSYCAQNFFFYGYLLTLREGRNYNSLLNGLVTIGDLTTNELIKYF